MPQEIPATLTLSLDEARHGSIRSLTLPNGRAVTVSVPAGAYHQQQLSFPLSSGSASEPPDLLVLTLLVPQAEETGLAATPLSAVEAAPPFPSAVSTQFEFPDSAPSIAPTATAPGSAATPAPTPPSIATTPSALPAAAPVPPVGSAPGWPPQGAQPQPSPYGPVPAPMWPQPQPVFAQPRSSSSTIRLITIIVVLVLVVGSIVGIALAIHSGQVTAQQNASATATADDVTATANVVNYQNSKNATATAYAQATATVDAANPNPYGGGGKLVIMDPLTSKDPNGPSAVLEEGNKCVYKDNAFHVIDFDLQHMGECDISTYGTNIDKFTSFALEVKFTIIRGDYGGFVLSGGGSDYTLLFDKDGKYQLTPNSLFGGQKPLAQGQAANFNTGYGQSNTLGLVLQGDTFTWYINNKQVDSATNQDFGVTIFSLIAANYSDNPNPVNAEVAYTNLRMWTL